MKKSIFVISLITIFALSMTVTPSVAAVPTELTLGGLFPLTGTLAAGGVEREAAFRMAIEKINADSTLLAGTTLKYVVRDTATDPTTGATVAQELLDLGVFGLVGAASSSVSKAIAKKAEAAKTPQISYSSTNPDLSDKTAYPYFLRVVPPDSVQGFALANIVDEFGWTSVATLASSDDYGEGGMKVFEASAKDLNITIASSQRFAQGASDVKTQLQAIVDSGAKIIVLNAIVADATTVFSQATGVGITAEAGYVWIGTDGPTQEQVFEGNADAKTAMAGMIGTRPNRGSGPAFDTFLDLWESKSSADYAGAGDRTPNTYASFAYDAVYAFAIAADNMIKAGADPTDGALLLKELAGLTYDGVTGPVSFNADYDREGVYDIVNLQGDEFIAIGSWDKVNGMKLTGTITWPDGTTETPEDGTDAPGFELYLALAGIFVMIPILRRKK